MSDWYFKVKLCDDGDWLAWAAQTPELGDGPLDVDFSLVVYFAFGDTEEEALAKVKREVAGTLH